MRIDLDVLASVLAVSNAPSPRQDPDRPVANPPDLALVCVAAVTELFPLQLSRVGDEIWGSPFLPRELAWSPDLAVDCRPVSGARFIGLAQDDASEGGGTEEVRMHIHGWRSQRVAAEYFFDAAGQSARSIERVLTASALRHPRFFRTKAPSGWHADNLRVASVSPSRFFLSSEKQVPRLSLTCGIRAFRRLFLPGTWHCVKST